MPSITFDIESYTVTTMQSGKAATGASRSLHLTSTAAVHGIRTRAMIHFMSTEASKLGIVVNVDQPNFDGLTAHAFCHKADFGEWYDIARNEHPLTCTFSYAGPEYDPNQPTRDLYTIQVHTGTQEPPGEGPEEVQSKLFPEAVLKVLRDA